MTAPSVLPIQTIYFQNEEDSEKLLWIRDKIQQFCDYLATMRPKVYSYAVGRSTAGGPQGAFEGAMCVLAYEGLVQLTPKFVEWFNDFMNWSMAPKNILDMVEAMQPAYEKATECKQALIREAMPADKIWKGESVNAYYKHIEKHRSAAADVEEAIHSMMIKIREAGSNALTATYVAFTAIIGAIVELFIGLIALAPPATPAGVKTILASMAFIGATVGAIGVYAQKLVGVVAEAQNSVDGRLRSTNFPGGKWPQATSKSVRTGIEDVSGWSY